MSFLSDRIPSGFGSFRVKLMVVMMLLVSAVTALGLYFAERNQAASVETGLEREFEGELAALHNVQNMRQTAYAEVCRSLVRKPRIHAALEDNAMDLLYPIAKDELRDVMVYENPGSPNATLQAVFYRFLDLKGELIPPPKGAIAGELQSQEESQLALHRLPREYQVGYLVRKAEGVRRTVDEVIAMPIISSETDEVIAALVIGFKPVETNRQRAGRGIRSGIFVNGQLHLQSLSAEAEAGLSRRVSQSIATLGRSNHRIPVEVNGAAHLLFYQELNPNSLFAPAYEVSIYPLTDLLSRQRQLRWGIVTAGALMLLAGLAASHFLSRRLSVPVEKLAVDSEEHRTQRARAEAELELTNEGLQRAIRFSSDASHQLKTPVTVLRAGLEELLAQDDLAPATREELSALVHQTYRLTSVIEDLLLLARADAGRMQLHLTPIDLTQLVEASLDDLGALPDTLGLKIETDFPATLRIQGDKRYSAIIVQNLLENAHKYNQPKGRIRITVYEQEDRVILRVGNTSRPIPLGLQKHIFERFHRGTTGENIPGHGLGLNLARELARLHGGDLRLVGSEPSWTEFEAIFRRAGIQTSSAPDPA